jgi:hypothetical protein|tara:strand:+ start:1140 stop:1313 length:174 start_codon:yes stop_codon:yes gene_type:complete
MKEYNTYIMQVGEGMAGALKAPEKKKYTRIDKRTKKYGNPRKRKDDWQGTTYKTKKV